MSCEICGRNTCTKSFHCIEEQEAFDNIADKVTITIKNKLMRKIRQLQLYESTRKPKIYVLNGIQIFRSLKEKTGLHFFL